VYKNDVAPGGNKALLTLSNGKVIELANLSDTINEQAAAINVQGNGYVAYNHKETTDNMQEHDLAYNTLQTPKGGQQHIKLSDGTEVWLNAASSLTFPVVFPAKERVVTLKGEGYFEVAKNAGKPFKVITNNNVVTVLGTHFNIMAYADEPHLKLPFQKAPYN